VGTSDVAFGTTIRRVIWSELVHRRGK